MSIPEIARDIGEWMRTRGDKWEKRLDATFDSLNQITDALAKSDETEVDARRNKYISELSPDRSPP